MVDTIEEEKTAVKVEVAELELYCARCCNGRTIIRPGGSSYADRVPCENCRPRAHRRAMSAGA